MLQQYVGRLHRNYSGKSEVRVYDYIDPHVDVLKGMHKKRQKGFRLMGYSAATDGNEGSAQMKLF